MKPVQRISVLLLSILIFFLTSNNASAQGEWSTPAAFTNDSLADNCNAYLLPNYYNEQKVYLVWERSTDSSATTIYLQDVLNGGEAMEILSDENIHYTHPALFYHSSFYPDTLFYLFYETDEPGSRDIRYIKYMADGSYLGPFSFYSTNEDDHSLSISGNIAWISGDNLIGSSVKYQSGGGYYFAEPDTLDEGGCFNPQAGQDIFYEKKTDTSSYLYKVNGSYGGAMGDPELFFDEGQVENLNKDPMSGLICWSAYSDSTWKIYTSDIWSTTYTVFEPESNMPFDPAINIQMIALKSDPNDIWFYLAFPKDTGSYKEIYMNLNWNTPDFINFSKSSTTNQNPNAFAGEGVEGLSCMYSYMIWESMENNHWQLNYSKNMNCVGGIEEADPEINSSIQIFPNPVHFSTTIQYILKKQTSVKAEILNQNGKLVDLLIDEKQNTGEQQVIWNPNSEKLKPGIYFLKLTIDGIPYSRKIVVQY